MALQTFTGLVAMDPEAATLSAFTTCRDPVPRAALSQGRSKGHGSTAVIDLTVDETITEGSRTAVRWSWRAVHQGHYLGALPSSKESKAE
jgi:hypothetical protein